MPKAPLTGNSKQTTVRGFLNGIGVDRLDWRYTKPTSNNDIEDVRGRLIPPATTASQDVTTEDLASTLYFLLDRYMDYTRGLSQDGERHLAPVVLLGSSYIAFKFGLKWESRDPEGESPPFHYP